MTDKLNEKLICAGRILEMEGHGDYVLGHVTAREPGVPDLVQMKPAWIGLDEMTQDNIITVDLNGDKVAGKMPRHAEVFIHTEIMRARPEINAVVHTHAMHAVVFSSLGNALLPVGHSGAFFCDGLPVFSETTELIETRELGQSVASALGRHNAMLLRNHGIVTVGRTTEEAVFLALHLETACQMQLMAQASGGPKDISSPEEAKRKKARMVHDKAFHYVFEYLVRRHCRCMGP